MAYFVEVDDGNNVLRVIVISDSDITAPDGKISESIGQTLCRQITGSANRWIRASVEKKFRRTFPSGPGFTYSNELDMFIDPSPGRGWTIGPNGDWDPPIDPRSRPSIVHL